VPPTFFFDLSSPFAYLAAERIDDLLPGAEWRPIAFGALIGQIGKRPWSLTPGTERDAMFAEIARRASERGLPEIVYPPGWPAESYSLMPLRAALIAGKHGRMREFVRHAYRITFVEGRTLNDLATILEAVSAAGLDAREVAAAVERPDVKDRLRANTDAAIARGVAGVPTVEIGGELFWGDDRLEDAAAALRSPPSALS